MAFSLSRKGDGEKGKGYWFTLIAALVGIRKPSQDRAGTNACPCLYFLEAPPA